MSMSDAPRVYRRGNFAFDRDFAQLRNCWLRDERISPDAKIMFALIAGCEPDFEITSAWLQKNGKMSAYKIRNAGDELESTGYITVARTRDANHRQLPNTYELFDPFDAEGKLKADPAEAESKNLTQPVENGDEGAGSKNCTQLNGPVENSTRELGQKTAPGPEQDFSEDDSARAGSNSLDPENLSLKRILTLKNINHHHPDGGDATGDVVSDDADLTVGDDDVSLPGGGGVLDRLGVPLSQLRIRVSAAGRDLSDLVDVEAAVTTILSRRKAASINDATAFVAAGLLRGWSEFARSTPPPPGGEDEFDRAVPPSCAQGAHSPVWLELPGRAEPVPCCRLCNEELPVSRVSEVA